MCMCMHVCCKRACVLVCILCACVYVCVRACTCVVCVLEYVCVTLGYVGMHQWSGYHFSNRKVVCLIPGVATLLLLLFP